LNISWGFGVLGKGMKERGRFAVGVPSAGDQWVAYTYLTLIMPNPRSTNLSEMSSAGVVNDRCLSAFICFRFWDRS
jgi:hypothetical protein